MAEWISVNDKFPKDGKEVLVTYFYKSKPKRRYVKTANCFTYDGKAHWNSVWDEYKATNEEEIVTHWMPMPEPPKEETCVKA